VVDSAWRSWVVSVSEKDWEGVEAFISSPASCGVEVESMVAMDRVVEREGSIEVSP
jgi:hypothetical protein